MSEEMKPKKGSKGFHFYPKTRKKKRDHTQFMDYERVLDTWGFVPRMYHIFRINNDYWACLADGNFYGNIESEGEFFRPVIKLPFWEFGNGAVVYGYIGVISYSSMGIHNGRFIFMKNAMSAAQELSQVVAYKYKVHLEKYKRVYLWMEQ